MLRCQDIPDDEIKVSESFNFTYTYSTLNKFNKGYKDSYIIFNRSLETKGILAIFVGFETIILNLNSSV